jgi:hypothetical protein
VKYALACRGGSSSSSSDSSGSSSSISNSLPQRCRCDAMLFGEFFCFSAPGKLTLYVLVSLHVCIRLATKLAVACAQQKRLKEQSSAARTAIAL